MPKDRRYGSRKTTTPEGKTEYQRDYMREYQRRKKDEKKNGAIEKLNQYVALMQRKRFELEQMTKIIDLMGFTVSRSDLTDKEKVARIRNIPIPNNLIPYFTKQFEKVIT